MEEETKSKIKRVLRNAGLVVMALFAVFGAFSAVLACRSCSAPKQTNESARLAPVTLAERKNLPTDKRYNLLDPENGAIEVGDRRINGTYTGTSFAAIHKNTNYNLWYTEPLQAGIYCYSRNTASWSGYRCLAPLDNLLTTLASIEASSTPWTPLVVADSMDVVNDEGKNTFYFQISEYLATQNMVLVTSVAKPYENIDTLYFMDGLTYPNIGTFKFAETPAFYSLVGGTPISRVSPVFTAPSFTEYFQVRSWLFRWNNRVYDGIQVWFGIYGDYPYVNLNGAVVQGNSDVYYAKQLRFHDAARNEWLIVGECVPQSSYNSSAFGTNAYELLWGINLNTWVWRYGQLQVEVLDWSIPTWSINTNDSLDAKTQMGYLGTQWTSIEGSPLIVEGQNPFDIIAAGFGAAASFFGIQLLPGITIGLLLCLPLLVTIILILVKLLQK